MKKANIWSGIILAVVSLAMLVVVIPWQIAEGPPNIMSPRLVPSMMMLLVLGLSVLLVVNNLRAIKANPAPETSPFSQEEWKAFAKFAAIFAICLGLFEWASPLVAGSALIIGTLIVLGERRPLMLALMPAGFLLAVWFLFYKVLGTAIL